MNAIASNEQLFIDDVDAFAFITHDVERIVRSMEDWLAQLSSNLQESRLACAGMKRQNALARHAENIDTVIRKSMLAWTHQWESLEPAHALAETFDDKVLLLVFGKFNAGKSSFCNLLADRFASHGKQVQYFYLEAGRIVETSERFKEGVTETTSRLQGVKLAEKLVLVDTPGLHSVTRENAALTQRFTDSADGVMWLTSSTSPGQVQELDELSRELHRNKPLLPVVTRSDVYEEDEVDGEIQKVLRSKTPENRAEQEADVEVRAAEKLVAMGVASELLKTPVSISSHLARLRGQTREAMTEAGFERLYAALLAITEPTLAYKRRKEAEVLLHHLEENVMGALSSDIGALLVKLRASSDAALERLERQREQIANAVWRSVMPALPELLEEHSGSRNVTAILARLSELVQASYSHELATQLADYDIEPDRAFQTIELIDDAGFDEIADTDGASEKIVSVDYQRLHAALKQAIHEHILRLCSDAARQCRAPIGQLIESAKRLEDLLKAHEKDLSRLKAELRSEFA